MYRWWHNYAMKVTYKKPRYSASVFAIYFRSENNGRKWLNTIMRPDWRLINVEYSNHGF